MKRWRSRNTRSFRPVKRRRTNIASGKRVSSGIGVTTQHDISRVYTKSRMPRRKRRRWKSFSRKVNAVAEKELGSRTVVFNKLATNVNSTDGTQSLQHVALYPARSSTNHLDDLHLVCQMENDADPTAALGITVDNTTKFIFKSAVLDLTFRNVSTLRTAGVDNLDGAAKMEVDVYEIISPLTWSDTGGYESSLGDAFGAKGNLLVKIIGGAGGGANATIDLGSRGVTPFDMPYALSYYRIKIIKKTKYFVNNGDTFTYQIRDPKRHVWSQEKMQLFAGVNVPRATRHLLIVSKLVPGLALGTSNGTYKESFALGITRKYFYKLEGANEIRDRYVAQT